MDIIYQYGFWLAVISAGCLLAERVRPWRREQSVIRPQVTQDVFWLVFNGYIWGIISLPLFRGINLSLDKTFSLIAGQSVFSFRVLWDLPFAVQVIIALAAADLLEWCVHNLLHRNSLLWKFHRLHHSIKDMDWIGNFRFHWGEVIVYKVIKFLPLAFLGARWQALVVAAIISTLVGHLNHSNLKISWGPLRYIFNSPRMHIWHHDKELRGKAGVNFAVVFSAWDWIFKTAYMPEGQPQELGFVGEEKFPQGLPSRLLLPFLDSSPITIIIADILFILMLLYPIYQLRWEFYRLLLTIF